MLWGMHAFQQWRTVKLSDPETYDIRIVRSDLNDVMNLSKSDLAYSVCKFLAEVVKVKDGSEYPGHTLYQFCVAIQKYLFHKGLKWKLIEGSEFENVRVTLDNLMKERAKEGIGNVVRHAEVLSSNHEKLMWEKGILGETTPTKLRETVLFLIGIHVGLRAGNEHYNLRHDSPNSHHNYNSKEMMMV